MNLISTISLRYLFGKKSTNAIHVIVWISIIGMMIGTASLILILSVFNGFESLLTGLLSSFNPDLKIELKEGKFYSVDAVDTARIKEIKGIETFAFVLEETSFFEYKGSQEVGILKGVDTRFLSVTQLDSTIIMGTAELAQNPDNITYGLLGSGMHMKLSVNPSDPLTPVIAYMPAKKSGPALLSDLNSLPVYPSGIFSVGNDIDGQMVIIPRKQMNELLGLENQFTAIEVKLSPPVNPVRVTDELQSVLGNNFVIKNRIQQDDGFFKIMNIEKMVSFLIATLTFLLIALNLVGSLWMIVLEKKQDISILKSMGMESFTIKKIFILIGVYVSMAGFFLGLLLSLLFYFLQKNYGIISLPDVFIIDAYPIEMRVFDIILVAATVLGIGLLAALIPATRASKISAFVRYE